MERETMLRTRRERKRISTNQSSQLEWKTKKKIRRGERGSHTCCLSDSVELNWLGVNHRTALFYTTAPPTASYGQSERERESLSLLFFFSPSSSSTFPSASSFDSSISPEPTLRCVGFFFFSPFLRENENLHLLPFSTLFIFLISFFLSSIPPSFFSDFHILTMIIFIFTSWQTHTWPQAGSTPPTTRVPHLFPSEISNNTSHEMGKTFPQSEMETIERSEGGPKKGANQSGQSTGWAHWFKEKGSRNYISAPPLQ